MNVRALASSIVLLTLTATACGRDRAPEPAADVETTSARPPQARTQPPTQGQAQRQAQAPATAPAAACPGAVPGTRVTTSETSDGVALVYTTTGDVADLRRRAEAMASRMDVRSGTAMGRGMGRGGGPGGGMGMQTARMPAATARVEEIPGGARVVLTPEDPAQLDELRAHVKHHATMMGQGQCPWGTDPQPGAAQP